MRRLIGQRRLWAAAGVLGWVVALGAPAALLEFFGADPNGSPTVPLTVAEMVESMAAEAAFKSQLPGAMTETFEGIATGTETPLAILSGTTTLNVGDGSGALRLTFRNGGETVLDRDVPLLQGFEADGSVLFFGVIAPSGADRFDQVQFNSTAQPGPGGDYFGFDNLTIVPEPDAAWPALVAMSSLLVRRTRRQSLARSPGAGR